jgi:hypothetical protein
MQEMDMMDGTRGRTSLSCMTMQELAPSPRRNGIGGRGTSVQWSCAGCFFYELEVLGAEQSKKVLLVESEKLMQLS